MTAIARDAHVARRYTLYRTVAVIKYFCRGKSGENFYTQIFSLPRKPAAQITKRSGVGALIMHEARGQEMGHVKLAGLSKNPMLIVIHGRIGQRTAHIAPIRQQFIKRLGVDDSTRKNVRANL